MELLWSATPRNRLTRTAARAQIARKNKIAATSNKGTLWVFGQLIDCLRLDSSVSDRDRYGEIADCAVKLGGSYVFPPHHVFKFFNWRGWEGRSRCSCWHHSRASICNWICSFSHG